MVKQSPDNGEKSGKEKSSLGYTLFVLVYTKIIVYPNLTPSA